MPADPLRKVKSGDTLRIPAVAYNAFVDAALYTRAMGQTGGAPSVAGFRTTPTEILVKNSSGAAAPQFGVLEIDGPLFIPDVAEDEFRARIVLNGITPSGGSSGSSGSSSAADVGRRFVILAEPIVAGGIGRAIAAGVAIVRLDIIDLNDRFAVPAPGDTSRMESASSGVCEILWSGSGGSGDDYAIVRFGGGGGSNVALVKVFAAIAGSPHFYDGKRFKGPITWSGGEMLYEEGLGTLPDETDCVLFNIGEVAFAADTDAISLGDHILIDKASSVQRRAIGFLTGTWEDGRPIYVIDKFADLCSPTPIT